jgi:DinB family protein
MSGKNDALAAEFYQNYISKAPDENVVKAIEKNARNFRKLLKKIPKKKIDYAYAEGKWTIRELVQHVIDAERVFSYRATSIARKDATPLPSFDENVWAANSQASNRGWKEMIEEFRSLRAANAILFSTFAEEQLRSIGVASNKEVNVLAIGYILAGHVEHHIDVIKERYLKKQK